MNLSPHFTREEIERSATAIRLGIENRIPEAQVETWKRGCEMLLEPIRDRKPLIVSSGYRCDRLNRAIGGSQNSQHVGLFAPKGGNTVVMCCAFDLELAPEYGGNLLLWETCRAMVRFRTLPFDQLIWEFDDGNGPAWVHISFSAGSPPRRDILRARKINGTTKYETLI